MVDAGLGAVAHRTSTEGAGSKLTFRCSCGKAFKLAHASQAYAFEGGDPRDCKALILRAVNHNERLGSEGTRRALVLGAIERALGLWKPPATLTTPERKTTPEAPRAERAPEGGGQVSRPPQSAISYPDPAILLGPTLTSSALASATPCAMDLSPTPAGGASAGARSDASPEDSRAVSSSTAASDADASSTADEPAATQLLLNGTDTLKVSWTSDLDPADIERWQAHLVAVQKLSGDGPESRIQVGHESWAMRPNAGRHVQYVLDHERATLELKTKGPKEKSRKGKDGKKEKLATVALTMRSETMAEWPLDKVWSWMEGIARALHKPEGASEESDEQPDEFPRSELSRADLFGDFLNLPVENADMAEFVCRPRFKAIWKTLPSGRAKIIGHRDHPDDLGLSAFWAGLKKTGHQFGKNELMARIYDKTLEIREVSKKFWLYDQWERCAACGAKGAEHEPVTPRATDQASTAPPESERAGCERTGCACFVIDDTGFMRERTCRNCEGTGKAPDKIICRRCKSGPRAKKSCGECRGEGTVDTVRLCKACKGKKTTCDVVWRVEIQARRTALREFCRGVERGCQKCAGLGERVVKKPCRERACQGRGTWACLACDATGQKSVRGRLVACGRCDAGQRTCKTCQGTGERVVSRPCRSCAPAEAQEGEKGMGWKLEKPKPSELVDPQAGLVIRDASRGARNVGEDLEVPMDNLEGFKAMRSGLWRYVVGGGRGVRPWLAWRVPNKKNPQRTRWKLRPEWAVVQEAPAWTEDAAIHVQADALVRVKKKRAKFRKLMEGFVGYASSMIALRRDHDDAELRSFPSAFELLYDESSAFLTEREEERNGAGWCAVTTEKQELAGRWNLLGDAEMERLRAVKEGEAA